MRNILQATAEAYCDPVSIMVWDFAVRLKRVILGALLPFRRLGEDCVGAITIYVALSLPVFIGGAVLAVDASRLFNLQTSLQKGADALALAAAAELDGRPFAMYRAEAAMRDLISNDHRFSTAGVATVTYKKPQFLHSLPPNDLEKIDSSYEVLDGDHARARFVKVTVEPETLNTIFPASFLGGSNTARAMATAVAGFTSAVCKTTPMFICNPFEGISSIYDASVRGRQIKMQLGGGGDAQYFPGNYGWLDSPIFGGGAVALRNALAAVNPPACFAQNGVTVKTGNIENANDAINVRFDLWNGPYNSQKGNSAYRPARNVRKGYKPGSGGNRCKPEKDTTIGKHYRLGQDDEFSLAGGRLGNGQWKVEEYFRDNYGIDPPPNGWTNSNPPSRYDVYRYELEHDLFESESEIQEFGDPKCYKESGGDGDSLSDEPDRRIIYAAILNCQGLDVRGSSSDPLPVLAFGKFFMTEPVPQPPDEDAGTIYSEFVGVVEPGSVSNEVARDIVQLYR